MQQVDTLSQSTLVKS